MPARNAQLTLARALDCLLGQDIADWEAIVVNDGSSDGTAEIIRYSRAPPVTRTVFIRQRRGVDTPTKPSLRNRQWS
ncbi:glycosyltransferase family A protein [Mesorhizobium sp. LNHC232B00]|uniref:glycosyltransferase family A protein n=1 Tax=Mesorhizobium sp. LNHC232B00 TaxID=1287243 RepID=UPI001FD91845|nr:glycosyltransferase family A protein [Mesorhizobium sp. LNHC232B00]